MTAIRVVLADDHTLVRAGIRTLLESIAEVEVVGEASDGGEALRLVRQHQPDLVLLDIGMKEMDGLQTAAAVARELPKVRIVMLSMHSTADIVEQALRAGASAYLVKDAATTELELAVHAVMRGDIYLSPAVSRQMVAGYVRGDDPRHVVGDVLTTRQRDVLQMIGAGKSTKEIARDLAISAKTVEAHRSQLMEKLGVRNVAQLMMEAVKRGLISTK